MGIVCTVMNMKGGVGKTTVTAHLAGAFALSKIAERQRKVLMIDYDPQFNLSQAYIPAAKYFELLKKRKTCLSVLIDDETDIDPFNLQVPGNNTPPSVKSLAFPVYSSLDLIPSTLDLMYVALGQSDVRTRPLEERFSKFISECKKIYDLILIDCHPAGSVLTKTSLQNSDHVLIPVVPQKYAVRGIGLMLQFIKSIAPGASGPIPHILFNCIPRTGDLPSEIAEIQKDPKFSANCMAKDLKKYSAFADPVDGKGFAWFSSKPYSSEAWRNLYNVATEFQTRTGMK